MGQLVLAAATRNHMRWRFRHLPNKCALLTRRTAAQVRLRMVAAHALRHAARRPRRRSLCSG